MNAHDAIDLTSHCLSSTAVSLSPWMDVQGRPCAAGSALANYWHHWASTVLESTWSTCIYWLSWAVFSIFSCANLVSGCLRSIQSLSMSTRASCISTLLSHWWAVPWRYNSFDRFSHILLVLQNTRAFKKDSDIQWPCVKICENEWTWRNLHLLNLSESYKPSLQAPCNLPSPWPLG